MLAPPPLPRTLQASVRDLSSSKAEVRASAVGDLVRHARGEAGIREHALPLVRMRLRDDDARVRAAAAVGLGDLGDEASVPDLVAAVDDDDAHVRQMALNALGELDDERALPRLRAALRDPRPEVRYQAIIAFTRVAKDPASIDQALLDGTNDDDLAIAHIALRVAEERLDGGKAVDERLVARARALVKNGPPELALVAAILLAKAGDASGHDLLLAVVRGGRPGGRAPDKEDERAAVEMAGELGMREAIGALERRAWGLSKLVRDTCPFHAKIALARMGHPRAVREILADLRASRPQVVSAAVVAAGRARLAEAKGAIERLPAASADPELVREALAQLEEAP